MNLLCPCCCCISWGFSGSRIFFCGILESSNAFKTTKTWLFMVFLHPCNMDSLWCEAKKSWPGWAVWHILIHQTSGKHRGFDHDQKFFHLYAISWTIKSPGHWCKINHHQTIIHHATLRTFEQVICIRFHPESSESFWKGFSNHTTGEAGNEVVILTQELPLWF